MNKQREKSILGDTKKFKHRIGANSSLL
jgi:hypothetical protein